MSCPAKKGNDYWKLRKKHGKDKLFSSPEIFADAVEGYFSWLEANPLYKGEVVRTGDRTGEQIKSEVARPATMYGLCNHLGITTKTYFNYEKMEGYESFHEIFEYVHERIKAHQLEGAIAQLYNGNLVARINNIKEQTDATIRNLDVEGKSDDELKAAMKAIETVRQN